MTYHESPYNVQTRMFDKRRRISVQLSVATVMLTVVLLLWRHSGCPGPPAVLPPVSNYLLVVPGNRTSLPDPYPLFTLPPNDAHRLLDLPDFRFLINNAICNDSDQLVVVIVHSDPRNHLKRTAIRSTWGSQLLVVFLVGMSSEPGLAARMLAENKVHHDIIQGNFVDAYRNMTYKHVMGLKWAAYHCPWARYVLKTDDDVFVHPAALVEYLHKRLSPLGARQLILCKAFPYGLVRRSYRSKWRVSYSEYRGHLYPPYCLGSAIFYSPDAVFLLYKEAQQAEYFWIDDVFVTGLMAARANILPSKLGDVVLTDVRLKELQNKAPHEDFFVFGPPDMSVSNVYSLWETVTGWSKTAAYSPLILKT